MAAIAERNGWAPTDGALPVQLFADARVRSRRRDGSAPIADSVAYRTLAADVVTDRWGAHELTYAVLED